MNTEEKPKEEQKIEKDTLLLMQESKYGIPLAVFRRTPYTTFESMVLYLKDDKGLSFHEIAVLLARDERNIWTIYKRAKEKRSEKIV